MPYSQEIYHIAKERLSERRQQALRMAAINREQLFKEIPRLSEINSELLSIGAAIAKAVVTNKPGENEKLRQLSEKSLQLQDEQEKLLEAHHIDKAILEPHYYCAKCGDTGYIEEDNRTTVCDCLQKLMADVASEQLSADLPLSECTFENFNAEYYSKEPDALGKIPYNRMTNIYQYCINYADTFSNSQVCIQLLMRAPGFGLHFLQIGVVKGLGKTHLSLAIANEVIKKGVSVIYTSAPQILSKLEREHFNYRYNDQEDTFNSLLKCDLLILDDLGTEFVSDFTRSCVYNLFNSRILANKPMIISTNLQLEELITTYSQRFVSRLIGSCDRLDFIGEDIRTAKK